MATLEPLGDSHELGMAYSNRAQLRMLAHDAVGAVDWGERALARRAPMRRHRGRDPRAQQHRDGAGSGRRRNRRRATAAAQPRPRPRRGRARARGAGLHEPGFGCGVRIPSSPRRNGTWARALRTARSATSAPGRATCRRGKRWSWPRRAATTTRSTLATRCRASRPRGGVADSGLDRRRRDLRATGAGRVAPPDRGARVGALDR